MNDEGTSTKLGIASSEKDLGVWIASKPNFTLQCDKASAKAMQSLYWGPLGPVAQAPVGPGIATPMTTMSGRFFYFIYI